MQPTPNTADLNKIVNAFTVYKFIKAITTPFEQMDAYKLGIIDRNGKFLKSFDELKTPREREASSIFNRLIINIKKIFAMVPDPRVRALLTTLPSAIYLIKEDIRSMGGDGQEIENFIKTILFEKGIDVEKELMEDAFLYSVSEHHKNQLGSVFGVPVYKHTENSFFTKGGE
tara:strand:- start:145 stop:660 length:516 start_codon:yes stop_codon:yes gene_type:complete